MALSFVFLSSFSVCKPYQLIKQLTTIRSVNFD
jgi:hypothetical protein